MKKTNKIVAIQGDPLKQMNRKTDTTLLLALEAQKRNYQIFYYLAKNLKFSQNKIFAYGNYVNFYENKKDFYHIKNAKNLNLAKAKFVLMRQNPPFNLDYITATYLLQKLPKTTKVFNDPLAVRNIPEKLSSIYFANLMPPSLFTKDVNEVEKFKKKYKKIVIKPTHGYGGNNILFATNKTSRRKIDKYLNKNKHVMAQKFLPQISKGDKRVFIINGKIKGAIRRVPRKNSILSNLGQGGTATKTVLNNKEIYVANKVASFLKKNNILFAGIDLVENYLIGDINVTSPTGLKNFKDLNGKDLSIEIWNSLEKS